MADVNELGDIKTLITESSPDDLKALLDQLTADEIKDVLGRLDSTDFPALLAKVDPPVLERVAQGISHPSELKQFLELSGGDDAIITAFVSKAGTDVMLDR